MGKIIGWLASISFLIWGLFFAQDYTSNGNMTAVGVAILCFGMVFMLSKTTYQTSRKVMAASTGIIFGTGVFAYFVATPILYSYTELGFYPAWQLCALVLGGPIIAYVFKHDK